MTDDDKHDAETWVIGSDGTDHRIYIEFKTFEGADYESRAAFDRWMRARVRPNPPTIIGIEDTVEARPRKIELPAGERAGRFLRAVLTPRAFRCHVQITITEMQAEWMEGKIHGWPWYRMAWIWTRGHWLIVRPFVRALCPGWIRERI